MADVRSLLRSHQQSTSTRIAHPLAAYSAAGSLRCLACGTAVQPRAWEGHVGSKAHRKRAAALRGEEDVEMHDAGASPPPTTTTHGAKGRFPAGFFSDASRAPAPREATPEEEEDAAPLPAPAAPSLPPAEPSALDLEFDSFMRDVLAPPAPPPAAAAAAQDDAFARATVFAEPELAAPALPQGFPESVPLPGPPGTAASVAGAEPAAPRRAANRAVQTASGEAPREEETEEAKRVRKEREEKELIMDRILDEERAQEEADERVESLKARLEAMKKARREKMAGRGK
ncbi:hypothetical protein CALCODRAFT_207717 [Calocera cornea HHB12733]|uniref:Coiled-coil domain-containing protein 16 n=1 Tax=Calocera cornea HHB12733 TaxID=1353952 RepID=A0A165HD68_9BASI|nr:hypothetical protein CALCODRAFT_207717 [Calocera cornea HHB12733]